MASSTEDENVSSDDGANQLLDSCPDVDIAMTVPSSNVAVTFISSVVPIIPRSVADDPMGSLLELRSTLGKKNVKYLLPSYVDMHGISKSKVVPLSHMMNMMGGSEMFTGAALDGVVRQGNGC